MSDVNVALIPARGGSIGIVDKNLRKVSGISLIKRTLNHTYQVEFFDKIIVSTDSYKILYEISKDITHDQFQCLEENSLIRLFDNVFLHKRATADAQTLSPISSVVFNLASKLNFINLWLLQPTSPFREHSEFHEIFTLVDELNDDSTEWSSIVSCTDVNGFHPNRMFKISGVYALPIFDQSGGDNIPRQSLERIYIKDGGFYLLRWNNLNQRIMLGTNIIPYIRKGFKTINIDSLDDLFLAEKYGINNG